MGKYQVKKGTIKENMISDYEGNNRGACLFCEAGGMVVLEDYVADDIPEGFFYAAFHCLECGHMWREISKFEEIERGL